MKSDYYQSIRNRKMIKYFGLSLDEFLSLTEEEQNILLMGNNRKIKLISKMLKARRKSCKEVTRSMIEQEKSINERIDNILKSCK